MSGARARARWIGLIAVAVVVAGLALAMRQARRADAPPPAAAPDSGAAGDAMIEQALRAAPIDSAVIKSRWVDQVAGLEYDDLDSTKRELFLRFANAERCECGCGYTLAGCLASDMTCEESRPHAQALLDSVRAGLVRTARGVRERPR